MYKSVSNAFGIEYFFISLRNIDSLSFKVMKNNKFYFNGSPLKNPDISGALYTLRIQYSYTQTQCEDGARDARVLQLTPVTKPTAEKYV